MIQNMTYFMKKIGFHLMVKDTSISLLRTLMVGLLMLSGSVAWGQINYVFYNETYGYIYNNNGTPSTGNLQFNKSSIWVASNNLGTTNRSIYSYSNNAQYLRGGSSTNLTLGSSANASNRWQQRNGVLNYYNNTNGYVKYDNGLKCGDNSGSRYTPYQVTSITDIAQGFSDFSINSGQNTISTTGTFNYGHTTTTYSPAAYTDYGFNNGHHYVNSSNVETTTNPVVTVGNTYYTWSLSDNASGYATVDSSTGAITVTSLPNYLILTLTCTINYDNHTATATKQIMLTNATIENGGYVIYDGNGHYLGGTNTTAITAFNPTTCLWTGTSGGRWQDGSGYYLSYNTGLNLRNSGTIRNWELVGTESGTSGQQLNYSYYYLRYNGGWTTSYYDDESGENVVFSVQKMTFPENSTAPTISGDNEVTALGTGVQYSRATDATYQAGYIDYIFYNGTHHYFKTDNTTAIAQAPAASTFNYSWSLSGIDAEYATIDANTGTINYKKSVAAPVNATVTLTATSTDKTYPVNKSVTFQPIPPTSISTTDMTINANATESLAYTLTPASSYHNVTASSSNTGVFTVTANNDGTVSITGVAAGTATLTLTALNTSGSTACSTTASIIVKQGCVTPTISFTPSTQGETATVTITTTTPDADIYYVTEAVMPGESSTKYTGPFEVPAGTRIRAIAIMTNDKTHWDNSDVADETYNQCTLAKPTINTNGGSGVTFASTDPDVTFYYTYGTTFNSYGEPIAPADPTTSSAVWHTGDAPIPTGTGTGRIRPNAIVKVIAVREGCSNSAVAGRWNTSEDYSIGQWVMAYKDDSDVIHFMENVPGTNNGEGSVINTTTFKPDIAIWEGLRYGDPNANYETGIVLNNNDEYFYLYDNALTDGHPTVPITRRDFINELLMPEGTIGGKMMRWLYFMDPAVGVFAELGFDKDNLQWAIPAVHISEAGLYQNLTTVSGGHYYCPVVFPVFPHESTGFDLNINYPANYPSQKEQINKGESVEITAFTSAVGNSASTPGTYGPAFYEIGQTNTLWHKYYLPNTSTPLDDQPEPTDDIRFTYTLVNAEEYCEVHDNKITLLKDPNRDLLVTVRVTATPWMDLDGDGTKEEITEGAQQKDYQFYILTRPPFPAPVISRIEGTNDYQMDCTAAAATIEYRINGEAPCATYGDNSSALHEGWCIYDGPITVITPNTKIEARSFRDDLMSDPVTYMVGSEAYLLPPVITLNSSTGNVTLADNSGNNSLQGYAAATGKKILYTVDGSDPDPEHVDGTNPTKTYTAPFNLTNGQTVKAIAVANGFVNSAVASETFKIASGIDPESGIVTINDYEDHNWSYYQPSSNLPTDYPDELHSPYPRNVEIKYYGYGNKTLSTDNSSNPEASTFDKNTTNLDVKVGVEDEGHTFLYYKTLERDANGRFPYELIPNPFYVRPDYRTSSQARTIILVMNDLSGNGWNGQLNIDFSNGRTTEVCQLASGSTGQKTFTVNAGVKVKLTWVQGNDNSDVSFSLYYDDTNNANKFYEQNNITASGTLHTFTVAGTSTISYTGFYKWRVKKVTDGAIYAASSGGSALATTETTSSDNVWLDAETTYYFQPTDNGTTSANNATSMKVELEALWALAAVNDGTTTTNTNYGSVERNFYIKRSGTSNSILGVTNRPITYSSFYPNGTTDGTTPATESNILSIHNNGAMSLSVDTKIEYYKINGNSTTITCNNHNLIIGRGVSPTNTLCATMIRGFEAIQANSYSGYQGTVNNRIRVESGTWGSLYLLNNTYYTRNGNIYNMRCNATAKVKCTIGNDYDRAKEEDNLLSIAAGNEQNVYGSERTTFSSADNKDNLTFDWIIKSGILHGNKLGDASADYSIYIGSASSSGYLGKRRITVEGGVLASIAGSLNSADNNNYDNNYTTQTASDVVTIRIKGGKVRGAIYGAAAFAGAAGGRTIILTGGTVNGWIAGGCNGTRSDGGQLYGSTYLYVGGTANVIQSENDPYIGGNTYDQNNVLQGVNGAYGGNIFGAGCGIKPDGYSEDNPGATLNNLTVGKVYGSNITIADESVVGRDVYGGGNFGCVDNSWTNNNSKTTNIYILGGTVNGNVFEQQSTRPNS